MAQSLLEGFMPKSFSYRIVSCTPDPADSESLASAELRLNAKTAEDVKSWIQEFSRLSGTNWIVGHTFPDVSRLQYKKEFVCHRSSKNKLDRSSDPRCEKVKINSKCKSKMLFTIKIGSKDTRYRDPLISHGKYSS